MKRARDEQRASETNEKGLDKAAIENGREIHALGSTSDITSRCKVYSSLTLFYYISSVRLESPRSSSQLDDEMML